MSDPNENKHPILSWFAGNPVVANILMVSLLAAGAFTALTVRKEGFPSFPPDKVTITVPVLGGTPQNVERGITRKIEDSLQGVDGIDHIRSESSENSSTTTITAKDGYDLSELLDDVKAKVDAIPTFPSQAEKPIITDQQRENQVLWVEIHGDATEAILKETARSVRDELLRQSAISEVTTYGSREYEISIEVSEQQMQLYQLTFNEVANAVSNNSVDLGGGSIRSERGDISLRTRKQAYVKKDFENIPLRNNPDGSQLLVKDVATVRDDFVDQQFLNRFNGEQTVSLKVVTKGKDDIILGVKQAKQVVKEFQTLPEGVQLTGWLDGSNDIKNRLALLGSNGAMGILLVLVVLMLFLNFRLAFWVAIGIPVSMMGALALFPLPGIDLSINVISAFGFLVVLGIVVDDAIVIGESIYTEKELQKNWQDRDAAQRATVRGLSKVVTPATFGVITTIAAFLPLTQVSGRMGNVFGQIATAVIFCLILSLVESKLILPSHLAHLDVHKKPKNFISKNWVKVQQLFANSLALFVNRVYRPTLHALVSFRYAVLVAFLAVLALTITMFPAGKLRFVFFPDIYQDNMSVILELEQGQSVDYLHNQTFKIIEKANSLREKYKEKFDHDPFKNVQISSSRNNLSAITAELTASEDRLFLPTTAILQDWREAIGTIPGARSLNLYAKAGPPGGDLAVNLESDNLEDLKAAAAMMKQELATYNGLYGISDSFDSGKPELVYEANEIGRSAANISERVLSNNVRDAFFGREAQRVQRGREEVKVRVRYPQDDRNSLETLRNMRIRTEDGNIAPFSAIATVTHGESLATIERYDGKRVVTVEASVDKGSTSTGEVFEQLNHDFFPKMKAAFPSISIGKSGEIEQREKSTSSLKLGLAISIVLIYILLAIPLKSYLQPLFIMSVIPFGIIGALLGHKIMGSPVSILSFFGIIALSGVVVNDSLVLIHRIQELQKEGFSYREAILEAAPSRFRAILLTSLTTFLGLYPLLLETQFQAQFLKPMAISLGFGVLFATLITLVLLPLSMLISNDIGNAIRWLYNKKPIR